MRRNAPLDPSEPPGGDFVRYVERLNTASAAQAAEEAAEHASRARQAQRDAEAPPPASTTLAGSAPRAAPPQTRAVPQPRSAPPQPRPAPQAPARPSAAWGPPSPLARASAWMIGAGIALVLLAVLSSGSAFIDTFLPGMLLIGAGLAFRKHFRKR